MAERQDREGNTQEAPRGAQEGPGRPLDGRQRRDRAARRPAGALGLRADDDGAAWRTPGRPGSFARRRTPSVVDREGVGDAAHEVGVARRLAVAPIADRLPGRRRAVNVAQVGFKPSAKALKPDSKKLNPLQRRSRTSSARTRSSRASRTSSRSPPSARSPRFAVLPKLDEMAALVGMPPPALLPHAREHRLSRRPARGARLPRHRRRRLHLAAAPSSRRA